MSLQPCVRIVPENSNRHLQTPEGKRIAAEGRQRWAAKRPPADAPKLFVVRLGAGPRLQFGWEIRKFGSIVLSRSDVGFGTQLLAQTAGEKAMTEISAAASDQP